jgi:hypothetical protein
MKKTNLRTITFLLVLTVSGCALYYHDDSDNSDHLYGFGHLAMKTITNGSTQIAVAKQVSTLGSELHAGDRVGVSLGWSSEEEVDIFDKSARLSLEKPSGDSLFSTTLNQ